MHAASPVEIAMSRISLEEHLEDLDWYIRRSGIMVTTVADGLYRIRPRKEKQKHVELSSDDLLAKWSAEQVRMRDTSLIVEVTPSDPHASPSSHDSRSSCVRTKVTSNQNLLTMSPCWRMTTQSGV